ncbi:hypothetical protein AB1Y20_003402 [Prymnesium parvum]|uniref:Inhibitor of kappa B-like protein n=1 Tax=Prymnesium parvum TaxID=97485 RepID=A0AB34JBU0_PRYPA
MAGASFLSAPGGTAGDSTEFSAATTSGPSTTPSSEAAGVDGVQPRKERRRWDPELRDDPLPQSSRGGASAGLVVFAHFRPPDPQLHTQLKLTLPPAWEERSIGEAVVAPFVKACDRKRGDTLVSTGGPYDLLRVRGGSLDADRDPSTEESRLLARMAAAQFVVLRAEQAVSALRRLSDAHGEVHLELLPAESLAIVVRQTPAYALTLQGERLIAMLCDPDASYSHMHAVVDGAIAEGELAYAGVAAARSGRGKTALHLAVTRGDLTLCRKLMRRQEDVLALDQDHNTPLHFAALAGRSLIVRELLEAGAAALLHEKNYHLMNALQLAVVDEAAGNGDVVRLLVEAGAEIDAKCWDITPLMAAASGGHSWAVEELLLLGADPNIWNGYMMTALDYCRDPETQQMIYDYMKGDKLPDEDLVRRQAEVHKARQQAARRRNFPSTPGFTRDMPGDHQSKGPRLFQSVKNMPLEDAFVNLGLDSSWLDEFRASGEHYNEIRHTWRKQVLKHHPDKHSSDLTEKEQQEHAAAFTRAMASFEAIDSFYQHKFAQAHAGGQPVDKG